MDNWKTIWSQKSIVNNNEDLLYKLISANGFDTGSGFYSVNQWEKMTFNLCTRLKIGPTCKVLEIGCGSGALLFQINKISIKVI